MNYDEPKSKKMNNNISETITHKIKYLSLYKTSIYSPGSDNYKTALVDYDEPKSTKIFQKQLHTVEKYYCSIVIYSTIIITQ